MYAVVGGPLGGGVDYGASNEFSPMVLFEIAGVLAICLLCRLLGGSARLRCHRHLCIVLMFIPTFVLGGVTGLLDVPGDTSNFLWEASIWVLLLAVFVYGMRTSLFAMRGLAVGVMWESWCLGQMAARVVFLAGPLHIVVFAVAVAVLCYCVAITLQLSVRHDVPQDDDICEAIDAGDEQRGRLSLKPIPAQVDEKPIDAPEDACAAIGRSYALSDWEVEVLRLLFEGRSAKVVSEELVISFNTARSHIRHIYEKLDIHSKQELIDCIRKRGE